MGKNKGGRPTSYTEEQGIEICSRIAEGESVRSICRDDDMPNASTIYLWVIDGKHEEFSKQYTRSREAQADNLFEELLEIADDGSNDWMEKEMRDGHIEEVTNHEVIQRSRLRVDTRKWALSKMLPKRFGDRVNLDHSGTITMTPHEKKMLDMLDRKEKRGKE